MDAFVILDYSGHKHLFISC